jgi:hypothetical protein
MARAKVAIFNDTSLAHHFGCDAVMATIAREVAGRGGEIIHRQPPGARWKDDPTSLGAIDEAALVIVNGEGTLHHSQEKAVLLGDLAAYCAERSKPAFLINATIEANDRALTANILRFTRIWVRDSHSQGEVAAAGGSAEICGDLSFGAELAAWRGGKGPIVIDSTVRTARKLLAKTADRMKAPFLSMRYAPGPAYRRRGWPRKRFSTAERDDSLALSEFRGFAEYLGAFDALITGRYHALCFAVNMGMPVAAIASNTRKNHALIADIGLDGDRLFSQKPVLRPYSDAEKRKIAEYRERVRQSRLAMFDSILPG